MFWQWLGKSKSPDSKSSSLRRARPLQLENHYYNPVLRIATGAESDQLWADTMGQYRPVGKAKRRRKGNK